MSSLIDAIDAVNEARQLVQAIRMASEDLLPDQRSAISAVACIAVEKLEAARDMLTPGKDE